MQLIDSHCHLDDERFDADRRDIINHAAGAGIGRFIVPAIHAESCLKLSKLSQQYESIKPAYGLHPWFCDRHRIEHLELLQQLLPSAVAVGECGLDFGLCDTGTKTQLGWLRPQLQMAIDFDLPVILHSVKATDMLIAEIKSFPNLRGVIHSFSGSLQQAEQLIGLGFHLGFGAAVTRPNTEKLHTMIRHIPLQYILLETDAPDQPPFSHKGERNQPVFLIEIAERLASLRGIETTRLAEACFNNTKDLFKL